MRASIADPVADRDAVVFTPDAVNFEYAYRHRDSSHRYDTRIQMHKHGLTRVFSWYKSEKRLDMT